MTFHEGAGSMAISPSAMERQRRKATRRSCTGSGAKSAAARSHSSTTRCIQAPSPTGGSALRIAGDGDGEDTDSRLVRVANHCRWKVGFAPVLESSSECPYWRGLFDWRL